MFADLFDNPWKILIIAIVIIVLFGSRKLPDAARSLGKSMRILKTEVQGLHEDNTTDTTFSTAAPAATPAATPAQIQPVATTPVDAHQAQIDALSAQLANLQQSVAANKATDSAQAQ
jgi:sec-independent protein translocase protein TatA